MYFNPSTREFFKAEQGKGASLNGSRLRVARFVGPLVKGIPYDYCHWPGVQPDARVLDKTLGKPQDYGSAIYQMCQVAQGKSLFTVFPNDTRHDVGPGKIMVEEAGGIVENEHGGPVGILRLPRAIILANNKETSRQVRELLVAG